MQSYIKRLIRSAVSYSAAIFTLDELIVNAAIKADGKTVKELTRGKVALGASGLRQYDPARERLRDTPHEKITVTSFDGTALRGHFFPDKNAKRVVIALHGWRSIWYQDLGPVSGFLLESGSSVLIPEHRGMGESGGKYMGLGMLERYDIMYWVRWIKERVGDDVPVYLYGVSLGAVCTMMTADLIKDGSVQGIIADCGFTSLDEELSYLIGRVGHLPYDAMRDFLLFLLKKRLGTDPLSASPVKSLSESGIPVLFFHGEKDRMVPPYMVYELYEAACGPKEMVTVKGAGHGMCYVTSPELYREKVQDFWELFDLT